MFDWFLNLNSVIQSLIAGGITFLLTCCGACCVLFFPKINKTLLALVLGFSSGVMLASAIYSLLNPAIELANDLNYTFLYPVFIGILIGFLFVFFMNKILVRKQRKSSGMLLWSMTIHNIPEGLCIGVAFGSISLGLNNLDLLQAVSLTLAIGLQNFPEGIASALPLQNEGYSKTKAAIFGGLTAIVEPFSAVLGCLLVILIKSILPLLLSFAAIIMIMVVINELLPESTINNKTITNVGFIIGFLVMLLLDVCL